MRNLDWNLDNIENREDYLDWSRVGSTSDLESPREEQRRVYAGWKQTRNPNGATVNHLKFKTVWELNTALRTDLWPALRIMNSTLPGIKLGTSGVGQTRPGKLTRSVGDGLVFSTQIRI